MYVCMLYISSSAGPQCVRLESLALRDMGPVADHLPPGGLPSLWHIRLTNRGLTDADLAWLVRSQPGLESASLRCCPGYGGRSLLTQNGLGLHGRLPALRSLTLEDVTIHYVRLIKTSGNYIELTIVGEKSCMSWAKSHAAAWVVAAAARSRFQRTRPSMRYTWKCRPHLVRHGLSAAPPSGRHRPWRSCSPPRPPPRSLTPARWGRPRSGPCAPRRAAPASACCFARTGTLY